MNEKPRHLRRNPHTRLKLASVLIVLLVAVPLAGQAASRFVDVTSDNPLAADIEWLEAWGITKGCDPTHFCPNDPVTREQMAAFLHRFTLSGAAGGSGSTGAQGPAGPAGANGTAGPQGPAGADGATGPQGAAGPQGPAGAGGADGDTGPQGPAGPQGETGPVGSVGPQGPARSSIYYTTSVTAEVPRSSISLPLAAVCAVGDVAVGGGFSAEAPNVWAVSNQPGAGPFPNAWVVSVEFGGGGGVAGALRTLTVHAVCHDI